MTTEELYTQLLSWIGREVEIGLKPGRTELKYHGKRGTLSKVKISGYDKNAIVFKIDGWIEKAVYADRHDMGSIVLRLVESLAERLERESQELEALSNEIETKKVERLDKIDKIQTLKSELRAQELEKFPTPDGWTWGSLGCNNEVMRLNGPNDQEVLILTSNEIYLTDNDGDMAGIDIEPVRAALALYDAGRQAKA